MSFSRFFTFSFSEVVSSVHVYIQTKINRCHQIGRYKCCAACLKPRVEKQSHKHKNYIQNKNGKIQCTIPCRTSESLSSGRKGKSLGMETSHFENMLITPLLILEETQGICDEQAIQNARCSMLESENEKHKDTFKQNLLQSVL